MDCLIVNDTVMTCVKRQNKILFFNSEDVSCKEKVLVTIPKDKRRPKVED